MRRSLVGVVIAALAVTGLTAAQANEQPSAGTQSEHPGISSVTDAQGNPVVVRPRSAGSVNGAHLRQARPEVQRGQDWWPYSAALPPYTSVNKRAEAMTESEIQINGVAIIDTRDPEAALRLMPKELKLDPGAQLARADGFYLVKIAGFSRTQEQIDALTQAGAMLGEYINVNTYVAKIPSASMASVRALPFVTWVGDYQPAYKISPRIGLEDIPADEVADPVTGEPKPWAFEVVLHKGAYVPEILEAMGRLGIVPADDDIQVSAALTVIWVRTAPDAVPALAQIPGVKWIAEKTYPQLMASATNPATIPMVLQNNGTYTTNKALGWKLWNAGIDGSATNQIVTMMDSGLNTKMFHFSQDTLNNGTVGPSHRKVVGYDVYGSGDQCVLDNADINDGGHGAKTSQHAVGSISNMTSNPDLTHTPNENWDDGIARGAKVYFQDIGNSAGSIGPPGNLGPSITAAKVKGSFIQNHSWGAPNNSYDSEASLLDTALFDNPEVVVTVSAGNRGSTGINTLGSPSTAKNAICVGGNDVSNPNGLFIDCNWDGVPGCTSGDLGSSRGPVSGMGRTKPDIMAFIWSNVAVGGEQMAYDAPSAMCQTDATKTPYFAYTNLGDEGGTSFAAPEIAGLAALVRDYFQQGFYPSGTATPGNALTPRGSLVKAVLLASGEDMNSTSTPSSFGIGKRYSSDVGYGRANLPGVLHIGSGAPFLWVQNDDFLGQAATKTFSYNINNNNMPLRVMMDYYDQAGDNLQKDADLRVTINGTTVYWGNNFSGGWSTSATTNRDRTNNTEGVFLDAAHGLPATGTVTVDVIGFNNPAGMNYSLVVTGNVASSNVQQVSLNKGVYTCHEPINITVNDSGATSPVNVTLVSKNSSATTIDTKIVSLTGAAGVFTGSITTGTGLIVANGGTITATYGAAAPVQVSVACQAALQDEGFLILGGCDNGAAGTNEFSGPLFNGGNNEFYTKYMDAGEYSTYKMAFQNNTGGPLTDVTVTLSFSGSGGPKMSALNGPIHIGPVAAGAVAGAVFQLFTDPSAAGVVFPTTANLDFDVTSPADGYTTPTRLTQPQILQANDTIQRQNRCSTFNTTLSPWFETSVASRGGASNPWRWSGAATTPSVVGSENRTDGICSNSTANSAAMVGNSAITAGFNFNANADSFLMQNFQPALRGNAPNGQPYHYAWKWHSFYHASETLNATTGGWGVFYNDQWNSATNPTGDQAVNNFPLAYAYFLQNQVFDNVGTWNWETANTGTPDDPNAATPPPNQFFITFTGVTGPATGSTFFAYGHEHLDASFFGITTTTTTRRDIALDNDNFVYDEFFASPDPGAACGAGSQVGLVAFDQVTYNSCPNGQAVLSVLDPNAVSGMTVTVTSPGTGDSEVVTLTGSAPYFSGTLNLSTITGIGTNNGTLFVLPSETLSASYTDASPAGTSTAVAVTQCAGGDVLYVTNAQIVDNHDNDGIPDNNECVTMDITIKNNAASPLTNAKVTIVSNNSNVDLIQKDHAYYGTVAAGGTAVNPPSDRFTFHVNEAVACTDPLNPPVASFTVIITGDGVDAPSALQTFQLNLDLNVGGGTTTYTQNFSANPNWTVAVTGPDNAGCSTHSYTNNFHWCAACGNAGGGYGAWVGNNAFGTSGQNYTSAYNSSTLYSPVFTAAGPTTLQFRAAYRTEPTFDGAIVQYQLGAGGWTNLNFTTPAQGTTTSDGSFCSPILASSTAWTGTATGSAWTLTNAASVPSTNGQNLQFRWRLGGDVSVAGATFGGLGVDDVSVTGLRQFLCEPNNNANAPCCLAPSLLVNNTAADLNLCVNGGIRITWPKDPDNWGDGGGGTRTYDVLRNGSPVASGLVYGTTQFDDGTATAGVTYTYTVRYNNGCGSQTITAGTTKADSNNVTCTASDQCHNAGVCAPSTGVCSNPPKTDGTTCTDGDLCTQTDTCQSGVCVGGNPIVCFQQDECHQIGTCTAGVCNNPLQPDGTTCDDGVGCTNADQCTAGTCAGTPQAPPELVNARFTDKVTFVWDTVPNSPVYDILRGAVSALPVGPGGGDEVCFDNQATAVLNDANTPTSGQGFFYLVRAANACGQGNYGTQKDLTPRTSTTCP